MDRIKTIVVEKRREIISVGRVMAAIHYNLSTPYASDNRKTLQNPQDSIITALLI